MTEVIERPLPGIHTDNERYWASAHQRALELPHCASCGEVFYPLSNRCRNCLSTSLQWRPVSGKAKLVTWNVMHQLYDPAFKDLVPYIVGVVELEEGARMITNIVGVDPRELVLEMPLTLDYIDVSPEVTLPVYRPVGSTS